MSDLLTVRQAAEEVRLSESALNKYRVTGGGPPYFKVGRYVRYDRADLSAWVRSRRYNSTSQERAA
jgi:predicted DNA-binding transcriptional regulator AlpA